MLSRGAQGFRVAEQPRRLPKIYEHDGDNEQLERRVQQGNLHAFFRKDGELLLGNGKLRNTPPRQEEAL
jgi:hypothetical protein